MQKKSYDSTQKQSQNTVRIEILPMRRMYDKIQYMLDTMLDFIVREQENRFYMPQSWDIVLYRGKKKNPTEITLLWNLV